MLTPAESIVERLFPVTCSFPCQLIGLILRDGSCFSSPRSLSSQKPNQKQYHHSLQHPAAWPGGLSSPPSQPSPVQAGRRPTGTPGFLPKKLGSLQGRRTREMRSFLWSGSNEPSGRLFSFPGTPGAGTAYPLGQNKKGAIKERRGDWARGATAVPGCPLLPAWLHVASTLCNHPCLGLGS